MDYDHFCVINHIQFRATIPHIPMWENQETEPAEPADEPEEEAL